MPDPSLLILIPASFVYPSSNRAKTVREAALQTGNAAKPSKAGVFPSNDAKILIWMFKNHGSIFILEPWKRIFHVCERKISGSILKIEPQKMNFQTWNRKINGSILEIEPHGRHFQAFGRIINGSICKIEPWK